MAKRSPGRMLLVAPAAGALLALSGGTLFGSQAKALQLAPPSGYGGQAGRSGDPAPADRAMPGFSRVPDAELAGLFQVDPSYRRAHGAGEVKVVGAFQVDAPAGVRVVDAWAQGFLPVTLAFSDGRCFSLAADYVGGTLSRGRLSPTGCERPPELAKAPAAQAPDAALRGIGASWGYAAYSDRRSGRTIVTAPYRKAYEPLFTTTLAVSAIMAMNGVDYPGGDVTLVGRSRGGTLVVTLEVGY